MRPFASTISLTEALAIMRCATVAVSRCERVPLTQADGRVLATAVIADRDVPPFDRSAMDGYAVRAADTAGASAESPVALRLAGAVFTGEAGSTAIGPGECVTIATGAPIPPGADAVVMVEQTSTADEGRVLIRAAAGSGQHVGRRGADIVQGDEVLGDGAFLTAARVGALAALGLADADVYGRPRVFVASTGNEIVEPGTPLRPGHIYDINRFTLPAIVRQHGGEAIIGPTAGDTLESLRGTLDTGAAAGADLFVLSGGSSVGDRDLLVDAVRERGDVLFHGIAVKPGKPTLLARAGEALLLGMPGNPTSCLSNAYILLIPLLRAMARLPAWRPETRQVPLASGVRNTSGRHTFFTVRLEHGLAVPAFKGSGDITSLAHADGYIEIPADVDSLERGAEVTVVMF